MAPGTGGAASAAQLGWDRSLQVGPQICCLHSFVDRARIGPWSPRRYLEGCAAAGLEAAVASVCDTFMLPTNSCNWRPRHAKATTAWAPLNHPSPSSRPWPFSLQRRGSAKRPPSASVYTAVIHCGSIRQAAQVLFIQELPLPSPEGPLHTQVGTCGEGEGAAPLDAARMLPALAAAGLLKAEGWVPSEGNGLLGGSHGSLPRMDSSRGRAAGSNPGPEHSCERWGGGSSPGAAAGGVPMPRRLGGGRALASRSERGGSGRASAAAGGFPGSGPSSLGTMSSAWSGDSALSYAGSDSGSGSGSGGFSYDSSASDGCMGAAGAGARGWRRVGWADEAGSPGDSQPAEQGRSPAQGGGQLSGGRRLLRHPSLTAARHDPDLGCLALVRFRFVKRPEWLVEGARLVVRDRGGGRAAAVGHVQSVGLQGPCLLRK
jgi:hypothetical protein